MFFSMPSCLLNSSAPGLFFIYFRGCQECQRLRSEDASAHAAESAKLQHSLANEAQHSKDAVVKASSLEAEALRLKHGHDNLNTKLAEYATHIQVPKHPLCHSLL